MRTSPENQRLAETSARDTLKLLLPVDATERSRWGIHYAIGRKNSGCNVVVSLLTVAEPITSWEVLRFYTQERVRQFQAERGRCFLEDAAQPLQQAGIPVHMTFREGDIVFEILDAAEQLECKEIVLPMPYPRWASLFSLDIAREVLRRQRTVPVTTVGPMPGRNAAGNSDQAHRMRGQ